MNWQEAREQYETSDCTQQDIALEMGVTKQAVNNRAKREGWSKSTPSPLPMTTPVAGSRRGLRCEENIATIIDTYALSGNKALACRQVGISQETLRLWCDEEPELLDIMRASRDQHLLGQYRKIANSKDWHAAKEILSRAVETREQWGENREKGPTIVLNIHRDEVVINQE